MDKDEKPKKYTTNLISQALKGKVDLLTERIKSYEIEQLRAREKFRNVRIGGPDSIVYDEPEVSQSVKKYIKK